MKFHLKLSENILIQSKISVLKYYNWKEINVTIEFCTIFLLDTNFQNCLILISTLENVFFNKFFMGWGSCYSIEYLNLYASDQGTTDKFLEEFVLKRENYL